MRSVLRRRQEVLELQQRCHLDAEDRSSFAAVFPGTAQDRGFDRLSAPSVLTSAPSALIPSGTL